MSEGVDDVARLSEALRSVRGASALFLRQAMEAMDVKGAGGVLHIHISPTDKQLEIEWEGSARR